MCSLPDNYSKNVTMFWFWSPLGFDKGKSQIKIPMTHCYWVTEAFPGQKLTFVHETFYPLISTEENPTGMFVPCSLSFCSVVCDTVCNSANQILGKVCSFCSFLRKQGKGNLPKTINSVIDFVLFSLLREEWKIDCCQ